MKIDIHVYGHNFHTKTTLLVMRKCMWLDRRQALYKLKCGRDMKNYLLNGCVRLKQRCGRLVSDQNSFLKNIDT